MGEALALASSWSRAAISASRPRLARSCRRSAKPPELPRPSMGGGSTAMTVPSDRLAKRWLKACTSSQEACPAPRTDQSLSVTKARAAFCPMPEKL